MRWLMNRLQGMVTLRAQGPFPERLINLCAQEGAAFWAVVWLDEHTLRLTVRRRQLGLLRRLAERVDCQVTVEQRRGLPDFLLRFQRRYAFLAGLALSLGAVALLSRFVLTIQVTGNQRVPTAVILSQLRQLGVRPGSYGPSIDRQQVAQEVQRAIEDLAWMGINRHGTRLEVIVREEVETPRRVDEGGCYDIVSEADGIVTHIEAEQGQAAVNEGDTVLKGETLISGTISMEPPKYSDLPVRYYQTHARGRVWARTWRTLRAAIPLEVQVKEYTGRERTAWSLELMGRRVQLFGGERPGRWEKTARTVQTAFPGETALPLALVREDRREYRLVQGGLDRDGARRMLEEALLLQVKGLLEQDGQIERQEFSVKEERGLLVVTLQAECREEIGREVPSPTQPPEEKVGAEPEEKD